MSYNGLVVETDPDALTLGDRSGGSSQSHTGKLAILIGGLFGPALLVYTSIT